MKFGDWSWKKRLKQLKKNNTWMLTDLPEGKNTIILTWIYKTKFFPDGSVEKHNARLVARGFTQKHGVDFNESSHRWPGLKPSDYC